MTSEHDYRNAVRYLQNLLNGGLMGARGNLSSDDSYRSLRTANPETSHLKKMVAESLPALQCGYWRRLQRRLLRESAL